MKLNVWYVQEVKGGFEAIRFTRRNGQPELMGPYPTIEEARKACGSPDAELM